jgi:hypothetical protein
MSKRREIVYEMVDYVSLVKCTPNRHVVVFDPKRRMTLEQVRRYYHGEGAKAQIKFRYDAGDGYWPAA